MMFSGKGHGWKRQGVLKKTIKCLRVNAEAFVYRLVSRRVSVTICPSGVREYLKQNVNVSGGGMLSWSFHFNWYILWSGTKKQMNGLL